MRRVQKKKKLTPWPHRRVRIHDGWGCKTSALHSPQLERPHTSSTIYDNSKRRRSMHDQVAKHEVTRRQPTESQKSGWTFFKSTGNWPKWCAASTRLSASYSLQRSTIRSQGRITLFPASQHRAEISLMACLWDSPWKTGD